MPLPPYLLSASLILCERVLHEEDGVTSAIRIVDIFYVPKKPEGAPENILPLAQAHGLVNLKAEPNHEQEHELEFRTINTVGEVQSLGPPMKIKFTSRVGPQSPRGVTADIQLNVLVKRFGTCFLCVHLDGDEVLRTPFTILQKPDEAKN